MLIYDTYGYFYASSHILFQRHIQFIDFYNIYNIIIKTNILISKSISFAVPKGGNLVHFTCKR